MKRTSCAWFPIDPKKNFIRRGQDTRPAWYRAGYGRTLQLLNQIGQVGRFSENWVYLPVLNIWVEKGLIQDMTHIFLAKKILINLAVQHILLCKIVCSSVIYTAVATVLNDDKTCCHIFQDWLFSGHFSDKWQQICFPDPLVSSTPCISENSLQDYYLFSNIWYGPFYLPSIKS